MASASRIHEVEVRLYLEENWPYESESAADTRGDSESCANQESSFDLVDRVQHFYRSNRDMKNPDALSPIIVVDRFDFVHTHRVIGNLAEQFCSRIQHSNLIGRMLLDQLADKN